MTKRHDVGPNHEPMTVKQIAEFIGMHKSSVHRRLRAGITGENLLAKSIKLNQGTAHKKTYDVGPNHEPMTVKQIADFMGMNTSSVYRRLKAGVAGEDLLAKSIKRNKKTAHKKTYDVGPNHEPMTVKQIAEFIGMHESSVYKRLRAGITGENLLAKSIKLNRKKFDEKTYDVGPDHEPMTVKQIAKFIGIRTANVYKRIRKGVTGKNLLAKPVNQHQNKEKTYDVGPNHPPMTITEISKLTGIKRKTIASRVTHFHITGERLLAPTYTSSHSRKSRLKKYDVGPNHSPMTFEEIVNFTGLSKSTISARIHNTGTTGADLIRPSRQGKQNQLYDVGDGIKLTLSQIASIADITVGAVHVRIANGITGAALIAPNKMPVRKYDVGPKYPPLTVPEIAKIAHISISSTRYRIKRGWQGEALLKPGKKY